MIFSIRSTLPPFLSGVTTVSVCNGDQCRFCRPSVRTAVLSDTFKSKKKCQTLRDGTSVTFTRAQALRMSDGVPQGHVGKLVRLRYALRRSHTGGWSVARRPKSLWCSHTIRQ